MGITALCGFQICRMPVTRFSPSLPDFSGTRLSIHKTPPPPHGQAGSTTPNCHRHLSLEGLKDGRIDCRFGPRATREMRFGPGFPKTIPMYPAVCRTGVPSHCARIPFPPFITEKTRGPESPGDSGRAGRNITHIRFRRPVSEGQGDSWSATAKSLHRPFRARAPRGKIPLGPSTCWFRSSHSYPASSCCH